MDRLRFTRATSALLVIGCANTPVVDLSDRPVLSPFVIAQAPDLKMAADSDAEGLRVVAEFVVVSPSEPRGTYSIPGVTLQTADRTPLQATATRMSTRLCDPASSANVVNVMNADERRRSDPIAASGQFISHTIQCDGMVQFVRAEFRLNRLPQVGDSVFVQFGATTFASLWTKPR
jgi:hypothetical protein